MTQNKRAIIVERDTELCEELRAIMEEWSGWTVDCARSVDSARPLLYCNHYNLIIIDYIFSRQEDGKELVKQFHNKVVVLSSFKSAEEDYASLDVKILHMPFNVDDFIMAIQT